jgi:hypothetical protein
MHLQYTVLCTLGKSQHTSWDRLNGNKW